MALNSSNICVRRFAYCHACFINIATTFCTCDHECLRMSFTVLFWKSFAPTGNWASWAWAALGIQFYPHHITQNRLPAGVLKVPAGVPPLSIQAKDKEDLSRSTYFFTRKRRIYPNCSGLLCEVWWIASKIAYKMVPRWLRVGTLTIGSRNAVSTIKLI